MSIIIGGPPSSGSSLLSVILNRHSKLACFQETHIFTKQLLFDEWMTSKGKIFGGKLPSPGWHQYSKVDLPTSNRIDKNDLVKSAESLSEFAFNYFSKVSEFINKTTWAEKTPANVYFFHRLNLLENNSVFILTIRHPYDIIASLVLRGKPIIDAVALCLLNMGIGYLQSLSLMLHVVKYESLVNSPNTYLQALCYQLNLEFEEDMITHEAEPSVKMKGWKHYEDGPIKTDSLNRFEELPTTQQERILYLCEHMMINPEHLKKYNIIYPDSVDLRLNINKLITHFGYVKKQCKSFTAYKPKLIKDRLIRVIKSHPSSRPYPIIYS